MLRISGFMILDAFPSMWSRISFLLWSKTPRNSQEEQISHTRIFLNDYQEMDENVYWGIYDVHSMFKRISFLNSVKKLYILLQYYGQAVVAGVKRTALFCFALFRRHLALFRQIFFRFLPAGFSPRFNTVPIFLGFLTNPYPLSLRATTNIKMSEIICTYTTLPLPQMFPQTSTAVLV